MAGHSFPHFLLVCSAVTVNNAFVVIISDSMQMEVKMNYNAQDFTCLITSVPNKRLNFSRRPIFRLTPNDDDDDDEM